jgi:hypothetical protein
MSWPGRLGCRAELFSQLLMMRTVVRAVASGLPSNQPTA